jgi:hypothetical protein
MTKPLFNYVWLNINDGTFSNSWDGEVHEKYCGGLMDKENIERARQNGWKLIEYRCLTDEDFTFYNIMQINTKPKKVKAKK